MSGFDDYTRLFDFENEPWQTLYDWSTRNLATQVPPMSLAEDTQHRVNQTVSALVELPSHPVEALVHNGGGGSMMQNAAGSSVRRKRGRGEAWTDAEHRSFLVGLHKYEKGQWTKISKLVKTKSPIQIASHAQKYFLRQNAPPTEKRRKSIHDISLHYKNGVPYTIDSQYSIPLPEIQQVHEMQQKQQMFPLNPQNSLTHQMRGFENSDTAYQQVHEMQPIQERSNPSNSMTHQMSGFKYSGIADQVVHEMQQQLKLILHRFSVDPLNSTTREK